MKKLVTFILLFSVLTLSLFGCDATPKQFSGKWNFSSINKVEIESNVDSEVFDLYKEAYNATNETELIANATTEFVAEEVFSPYYINFTKKYVYSYDHMLEREATWVFYQLSENEGFISFYAELDASEGNPDPITCPTVVYNPESDVLHLIVHYRIFMVTVELTR